MIEPDLVTRYNYDSFVPENFEPWMRFDESPALDKRAPDFPLLALDRSETTLARRWEAQDFLIVEFGSFT